MGTPLIRSIDFTSLTRGLFPKLITHWLKYCLQLLFILFQFKRCLHFFPLVYSDCRFFWLSMTRWQHLTLSVSWNGQACHFSPNENVCSSSYHFLCFSEDSRAQHSMKSEEGISLCSWVPSYIPMAGLGWHFILVAALHPPDCLLHLRAPLGIQFYTTHNFRKRKGLQQWSSSPQVCLI